MNFKLILIGVICILSLNSKAQTLVRTDHFPGIDDEIPLDIVPDYQGGYYCSIYFTDSIAPDPSQPTNFIVGSPSANTLVTHIDANGNLLWYIPFLDGGTGIQNLTTDSSGNLYLFGTFTGTMVSDSVYGFQFINPGSWRDIYFAKVSYNGNLLWVNQLNDISGLQHLNLASIIDYNNNVITIAGKFHRTVDFNPGSGTLYLAGPNAVNDMSFYIGKYDATTGALITVCVLNGTGYHNEIAALKTNDQGKVYIAGSIKNSVDFSQIAQINTGGQSDFFIACFTSNLNAIWVRHFPDLNFQQGIYDMELTTTGILLSGSDCGNVDFDPSPLDTVSLPIFSSFMACYDTLGNFIWVNQIGQPSPAGNGTAFTISVQDTIVMVGGFYNGMLDLDPSSGTFYLSSGTTYQRGYLAAYYSTTGALWQGWSIGGSGSLASQILCANFISPNHLILGYSFDGVIDTDILPSGINNVVGTAPSSLTQRDVCVGVYEFLTLSTEENNNNNFVNDLDVYPNPTADQITIKAQGILREYMIVDSQGKCIVPNTELNCNDCTISVAGLSHGFYTIIVNDGYKSFSKSFIIESGE